MIRYSQSRKDKNHNAIVVTLQKLGASVMDISTLGHGRPDIVIGFKGKNYLAEIKDEKGKLNDDQVLFSKFWLGSKIEVLRTSQDCVKLLF